MKGSSGTKPPLLTFFGLKHMTRFTSYFSLSGSNYCEGLIQGQKLSPEISQLRFFFKGHPARKGHMRRLFSEGAGGTLMTHDLFILHFYCTEMPSERFKIIQKTLTHGFQTAPFPAHIPSHKSYSPPLFSPLPGLMTKIEHPRFIHCFSHYKYLFIIYI